MNAWKTVTTVVAVGFTLVLAAQNSVTQHIRDAVDSLGFAAISILVALFLAMRVFQALSFRAALGATDTSITLANSLGLIGLKGFFNMAFSGAGLVAQALRGRTHLEISIKNLAFATILQGGILVSLLGLAFGIFGIVLAPEASLQLAILVIGLGVAIIPPLLWIAMTAAHKRYSHWLPPAITKLLEGSNRNLEKFNLALGPLTIFQLCFLSSRLLRILIIAYLIQPNAQLGLLSLAVLAADIASAIPITPGGIGVRELVIGAGGAVFDQFDLFLSAAIVDRAIALLLSVGHGLIVIAWHQIQDYKAQRHPVMDE